MLKAYKYSKKSFHLYKYLLRFFFNGNNSYYYGLVFFNKFASEIKYLNIRSFKSKINEIRLNQVFLVQLLCAGKHIKILWSSYLFDLALHIFFFGALNTMPHVKEKLFSLQKRFIWNCNFRVRKNDRKWFE